MLRVISPFLCAFCIAGCTGRTNNASRGFPGSNSTPNPDQSTTRPDQSNPIPDQSSTRPDQSTPIPDQSSPRQDQSTTTPDQLTPMPDLSSTRQDESTMMPDTASTRQDQLTTRQDQSVGGNSSRAAVTSSASWSASVTAPASTVQCSGNKIGTYAWSQDYWRFNNDSSLLDFLDSAIGRGWACADLSINIADYSNPDQIANSAGLVTFIQEYRLRVQNWEAVVWLTYGDVVEKSTDKMVQFTGTFFKWAASIPSDVAASMGKIGISYDVEHIDPAGTQEALLLAQQLRRQTNFAPGTILIQHTIEGDPNVVGTDYVMRYADSALAMVYRNYMHDVSGRYQDDSNILNRLLWMLQQQCVHCLDDAYATQNFAAKITVMVEASCRMGAGCGKISMCAFDSDSQGAVYTESLLQQMTSGLLASGSVSPTQYERLFSASTPYTAHNWEWFRCFAPFSSSFQYPSCSTYRLYAASCRSE